MVAYDAIVDDSESFPNKLLALIRTAGDEDLLDAISWLPHGECIVVPHSYALRLAWSL